MEQSPPAELPKGRRSPALVVRHDTGALEIERAAAGRLETELAHFDEIFGDQPYDVQLYAAARLVIGDPAERQEVVAHFSPDEQPDRVSLHAERGLERFRAAHALFTRVSLATASTESALSLRADHALFTLLTGRREDGLRPRSYTYAMERLPETARPAAAARLRGTMHAMARYFVRSHFIDADKLWEAITARDVAFLDFSVPALPTEDSWQSLRVTHTKLGAVNLRQLVRLTPESADARCRVVEYFLPSLLRRLVRYNGEDRDELLQLGAEQIIRSSRYYAETNRDEPFEPYMSQILSRLLHRALFSRRAGHVMPLRPEVALDVQRAAGARRQLIGALGREPSVREVAESLGVQPEDIWTNYSQGLSPLSEDAIPERPASVEPQPGRTLPATDRIVLERALEFLSSGLRSTVERYYGLGGGPEMTQTEIAHEDGAAQPAIKERLQKAHAELRTAVEQIRAGGRYTELQRGRTTRSVLVLYEWCGLEIAPDAELEDLREEMGAIILRMPQFNERDKEVLCKFYGLAGYPQESREALSLAYGMKPWRLTDLERKLQRIAGGQADTN
ncbi:MAG TPA: hypothetical protein VF466_03420 [Candidatus Saccharimonadales bacterium]